MKRIYNLKVTVIILCALCSAALLNAQTSQPNIVWIVTEDNSKHYLQPFDPNGAPAPNIQALADEGLIFHNAFSNSPVCSAARSTIISGCYGARLGMHYHRKTSGNAVVFPEGLEPWPKYLRDAGYYTTNNSKTDYNIKVKDAWNESSSSATWRNRAEGQPFFHVQNYMDSHESRLIGIGGSGTTTTDQETVFIPPTNPQTPFFKYTYAKYHDIMMGIDRRVGSVVDKLREDGLLENTFIFYYGDHGGVLPGSKGFLYETGLNVPMVVRIPENYRDHFKLKPGMDVDGFVSFVDLGATILNIVGLDVPEQMDGTPFLDKDLTLEQLNERDSTYSYSDRNGEKCDMVRSYRKSKYKYIRNYQPFNADGIFHDYHFKMESYREWRRLYDLGELNDTQAAFFRRKPAEVLFNIEDDPYETNNLATDEAYQTVLEELRSDLIEIEKDLPDLSFYPEYYLIENSHANPVEFGQLHKAEIQQMVDIANLSLYPFESIKEDLNTALNSENEWFRYWGLIVCSSHLTKDSEMIAKAKQLANEDTNLLVRMRAAEYLALIEEVHPREVYLDILSQSSIEMEAILILNSAIMLMDTELALLFDITLDNIQSTLRNRSMIKTKINYFKRFLAPIDVKADKGEGDEVIISWNTLRVFDIETSIERSFKGGEFEEIARIDNSYSTYTDVTTNGDNEYTYRMRYFTSGSSNFEYSNTAVIETLTEEDKNVALNKTTTVSSTYNDSYIGGNAVDGDNSDNTSRWMSANGVYPQWIEVDLGGDYEIKMVKLWTGYNGYNKPLISFNFQKWNGTDWEDIFSESSNSQAEYVSSFNPVITNKVRLYITGGEDNIVRLFELEVYGSESIPNNIRNAEDEQIILYPNPATNMVNIKNVSEDVQFEVLSMDGKLLKQGTGKNVDISELTSGFYMIRINNKSVFKIIKK